MTTLEELRETHQSKWMNTVTAFKRQHTMMNNLLTEVKQIAKDMVDPRKKVDGTIGYNLENRHLEIR